MADLEDTGYLDKPHTSSGRVPSDRGYRFYVDGLMPGRGLLPMSPEPSNLCSAPRCGMSSRSSGKP